MGRNVARINPRVNYAGSRHMGLFVLGSSVIAKVLHRGDLAP